VKKQTQIEEEVEAVRSANAESRFLDLLAHLIARYHLGSLADEGVVTQSSRNMRNGGHKVLGKDANES
jgi:hypothetical protein